MSISFMLIIVYIGLNSADEVPRRSSISYALNSRGFSLPYARTNTHTNVSGGRYPSQPLKVHISTVTHSNLDGHMDLAHTHSQPDRA